MTRTRFMTLLTLLHTAATLLGCEGRPPADGAERAPTSEPGGATPELALFDRDFVDTVAPQRVFGTEMARIARARAEHVELKKYADDYIRRARAEIEQLEQWRGVWYGSTDTPTWDDAPATPGMPRFQFRTGWATPAEPLSGRVIGQDQLAALKSAPAPFDRVFLDAMIEHERFLSEVARVSQLRAEHAEIRQYAGSILDSTEQDVAQLRDWRTLWYEELPTQRMRVR